jgi:hypothetical protein
MSHFGAGGGSISLARIVLQKPDFVLSLSTYGNP